MRCCRVDWLVLGFKKSSELSQRPSVQGSCPSEAVETRPSLPWSSRDSEARGGYDQAELTGSRAPKGRCTRGASQLELRSSVLLS